MVTYIYIPLPRWIRASSRASVALRTAPQLLPPPLRPLQPKYAHQLHFFQDNNYCALMVPGSKVIAHNHNNNYLIYAW